MKAENPPTRTVSKLTGILRHIPCRNRMSKMFPPAAATDQERARHIVAPYRLVPGVYVLGCLEKGVTVYRQQVRAHNLVWALSELARSNAVPFKRVAIIGGGIAGLTATACLLSHLNEVRITLFERRLDLCPRQQGSELVSEICTGR